MIGAGAGVVPLVALLQSEPYNWGEAVLVTRDHSRADAMRTAEIQRLVATRGVWHLPLDGPRAGVAGSRLPANRANWRGPDLIRHLTQDVDDCDVYLCGPVPWMTAVRADLRLAGVAPHRVHSEAFAV